jgi:hexokinase
VDKSYNGWTNYETWCVKLHMDNDESLQRCYEQATRQAIRDFEEPDRCVGFLADRIEDWHKEAMPEVQGVFCDLLNASLSEVNWHEIARNLVEEYREEVSDANG